MFSKYQLQLRQVDSPRHSVYRSDSVMGPSQWVGQTGGKGVTQIIRNVCEQYGSEWPGSELVSTGLSNTVKR